MATLYPDTEVAVTNLSGTVTHLQDDNTSDWYTTADSGSNTELHVGMENPGVDLSGTQTIAAYVRQTGNGNNDPDVTVSLYENGTEIMELASGTVTSATGEELTGSWSAADVSTPADVEIVISGSSTGGRNKDTVEVGYVRWDASLAQSLTVSAGNVNTIEPTSARLFGSLQFEGYTEVEVWFDVRPVGTTSWTLQTDSTVYSSNVNFSKTITGLDPDTEYEFRSHADVPDDSAEATDPTSAFPTFTTDAPTVTVVTDEVTQVRPTVLTVTGSVTKYDGYDGDGEVWMEYRPEGEVVFNTTPAMDFSGPLEIEETITGLDEDTAYEFRTRVRVWYDGTEETVEGEWRSVSTKKLLVGTVNVEGAATEGIPVDVIRQSQGETLYSSEADNSQWAEGYAEGAGSVNMLNNSIQLSAGAAGQTCMRTIVTMNTYDLTDIDMIEYTWENNGNAVYENTSHMGVSTGQMGDLSQLERSTTKHSTFSQITETLDVSDLSGKYHVRFHAEDSDPIDNGTSTISVDNVVLLSSGFEHECRVMTHPTGTFTAEVPGGELYHILTHYEDSEGTQYAGLSNPYVGGEQ